MKAAHELPEGLFHLDAHGERIQRDLALASCFVLIGERRLAEACYRAVADRMRLCSAILDAAADEVSNG